MIYEIRYMGEDLLEKMETEKWKQSSNTLENSQTLQLDDAALTAAAGIQEKTSEAYNGKLAKPSSGRRP